MSNRDRFQAQLDRLCRVEGKPPVPPVTGIARELAKQKEAEDFWLAIRAAENNPEAGR